jgi:hypothetical protein
MKISKKIPKPDVTTIYIDKLTKQEINEILKPVFQNQGYRINLGHKHENLKRNLFRYFNVIGDTEKIVKLIKTIPDDNYQIDEVLFSMPIPENIESAIVFRIEDYN